MFNPKSEIKLAGMRQDVGAETLWKNRSHTRSGLVRFFQTVYAQQIDADRPVLFRISGSNDAAPFAASFFVPHSASASPRSPAQSNPVKPSQTKLSLWRASGRRPAAACRSKPKQIGPFRRFLGKNEVCIRFLLMPFAPRHPVRPNRAKNSLQSATRAGCCP